MSNYYYIKNKLEHIYENNPFSLALHTTNSGNISSILENGLEERCGRVIEGTIHIYGDMKNDVIEDDFDHFFPYTDSNIVIGIPKFLEAKRGGNAKGGDKCTCEFSDFCEFVEMQGSSILPSKYKNEFSNAIGKKIPSAFILGSYDKNGNFQLNEKSVFLEKDSKYIEDLKDFWEDKNVQQLFDLTKSLDREKYSENTNFDKTL